MSDNLLIFPAPLRSGDRIAICSPAGKIDPQKVYKAADVLRAQGWTVDIMPHALGSHGNYSGTDDERFDDLKTALLDPDIKAIVCSRGGYGVVHLLDRLSRLDLRANAKWIAGFSDISAIHALMSADGVASIHSSMTAHIGGFGAGDPDNEALFAILRGDRPVYTFDSHHHDRCGIASGPLLGGNLAVIAELISTPYDIIRPESILFIEDLNEPIYKIERILYQLRLSGVLGRLAGLVVGQFTLYKPDDNYQDMYDMIRDMVKPFDFPVAFNAPIGHVDHNIPLIESAPVTLKVSPSGTNSIIFHRSSD